MKLIEDYTKSFAKYNGIKAGSSFKKVEENLAGQKCAHLDKNWIDIKKGFEEYAIKILE